jgi:hypothetical protein
VIDQRDEFRSTEVSEIAATISFFTFVQTGFALHFPTHALAAYLRFVLFSRLCLAEMSQTQSGASAAGTRTVSLQNTAITKHAAQLINEGDIRRL